MSETATAVITAEPLAAVSAPPRAVTVAPAQAHSDGHLVDLWLHGRGPSAGRAYAADSCRLPCPYGLSAAGGDVRRPARLPGQPGPLATATQARRLSAVKSLLSFGHKAGYLAVNVGTACGCPRSRARSPSASSTPCCTCWR